MSRGLLSVLLLSGVPFTGARAAAAQVEAPDDADPRQEARRLFEVAAEDLRAGRPVRACHHLDHARELHDAPSIRWNLAVCSEARGQLVAAREHLLAYLRQTGDDDPRALEARRAADGLAARLSWVTLELPEASAGARVRVDGVEVPRAGLGHRRPVDPGERVVSVELDGRAERQALVLGEGEERRHLLRLPAPAPPEPATVARPHVEPASPAVRLDAEPVARARRRWLASVGAVTALAATVASVVLVSRRRPDLPRGDVGGVIVTGR